MWSHSEPLPTQSRIHGAQDKGLLTQCGPILSRLTTQSRVHGVQDKGLLTQCGPILSRLTTQSRVHGVQDKGLLTQCSPIPSRLPTQSRVHGVQDKRVRPAGSEKHVIVLGEYLKKRRAPDEIKQIDIRYTVNLVIFACLNFREYLIFGRNLEFANFHFYSVVLF